MNQQQAQRAFRNAVGAFATGVTIATTADHNGQPVGVTASSFNSVSLDPPLVLWSLSKDSLSYRAFCESGHFAVHVLGATQEELSNRFARTGTDKFAGVNWAPGAMGSPILSEYAALFQCTTRYQYDGGDHVILVGEVVHYDACDIEPLLFHAGRYAERRPRLSAPEEGSVDLHLGQFTDNFLFYLVTRAHYQMLHLIRQKMAESGVSQTDYVVLAALSMEAPLPAASIAQIVQHTGFSPNISDLDSMVDRGLLTRIGENYGIAEGGRKLFIATLAEGMAVENDLAAHFTPSEIFEAKRILKRVIDLTGQGVPMSWRHDLAQSSEQPV